MKIPKNTCHRRRLYVGSIFSFGSSGRCGSGLRIFHITIDFDYQFSNTTYILFVLPNHARFRNSSKLFTLNFISFRYKSKRFHFQNKASEQKKYRFRLSILSLSSFSKFVCFHSNAFANIEIGCSQRFEVDISICHLQVSQSVTT